MTRKLAVAIVAMALIVCAVGCGRRSVTVKGPGGEKTTVTTDKKGGKTTVKGPEGEKATIETDAEGETTKMTFKGEEGETTIEISEDVDLSDLGVAVYPGAKQEGGGSYSATGDEAGSISGANLTTPDSYKKVAKFYKDKYSKGALMTAEKGQNLMIQRQKGDKMMTINVQREEGDKETKIAISVIAGMDM